MSEPDEYGRPLAAPVSHPRLRVRRDQVARLRAKAEASPPQSSTASIPSKPGRLQKLRAALRAKALDVIVGGSVLAVGLLVIFAPYYWKAIPAFFGAEPSLTVYATMHDGKTYWYKVRDERFVRYLQNEFPGQIMSGDEVLFSALPIPADWAVARTGSPTVAARQFCAYLKSQAGDPERIDCAKIGMQGEAPSMPRQLKPRAELPFG